MERFNRLKILADRACAWERQAIDNNDYNAYMIFSARWHSIFRAMFNDTFKG